MGFGYKTSWIAVRGVGPEEVARALALVGRTTMGFEAGTGKAYREGVYVAPPIGVWTLAHGREVGAYLDGTDPEFTARLEALSERLGEVQCFGTHRVVEYHLWAWAREGRLVRGYCYVGRRSQQIVSEQVDARPTPMVTAGVTPRAGVLGTTPADTGRQCRPGSPRRGSASNEPF